MTSPPATPLHTGAVGLLSLHVAPAAVVLSERVGVAADARVTVRPTSAPPLATESNPIVASSLEMRFTLFTFPP